MYSVKRIDGAMSKKLAFYLLIVLWGFRQQFLKQSVLIIKLLCGLHYDWTRGAR